MTPAQVAACDLATDGTFCSYPGQADGECYGGVCLPIDCGNDIVEPGELCDDGNIESGDGCSRDCQSKETCGNGYVDTAVGEDCDDGGTDDGDGCSAICTVELCGNGRLDANEVCDDDNNLPGDGCSPDCRSDETCGNGYVDYLVGETCDDGNFLSRDGCSSGCLFETRVWRQLTPPEMLSRDFPALAFDSDRGRVLLFGGDFYTGFLSNHRALDDTWEWAGHNWVRLPTESSPPRRAKAVMAYDAGRGRMVLVGGRSDSDSVTYDDVWEFDGRRWSDVSGAGEPTGVAHLAYDAARRKMVALTATETWEYDGTSWMKTVASAPPASFLYYDSTRRAAMALAGTELLEYDGSSWSLALTTSGAAPNGGLYFDSVRGRLASGPYALVGTDWVSVGTGGSYSQPIFDPARDRAVAFSCKTAGQRQCNQLPTYEFDGSSWVSVQEPVEPIARVLGALTEDPSTGLPTLLGGLELNAGDLPGIWQLRGDSWERRAHDMPGERFAFAHGYDPKRRRVLLVDGSDGSISNGSPLTRHWTGFSWTDYATSGGPPGTLASAAAYHVDRDRLVVYGGQVAGDAVGETYELAGSSWSVVTASNAPGPRGAAGMTYDTARQLCLLFGGAADGETPLADTWTYGTGWSEQSPATSPLARGAQAQVYDPRSGETLVLSGTQGFNVTNIGDAPWVFDGANWRQIAPAGIPPLPTAGAMATYDLEGRRIIQFGGGEAFTIAYNDTHTLSYASSTPDEICAGDSDDDGDGLVDCADPDCMHDPRCPESDCSDGDDNDGDSLADCMDRGCDGEVCATDSLCYRGACVPCDQELGRDGSYTLCAVTSAFEDISGTGTLLGTDDNGAWQLALPFELALYADVTSTPTVHANGAVTFRDGALPAANSCLPAQGPEGGPILAPLWDDLIASGGGEGVYYQILGPAHNRRLIVQWEMRHAPSSGPASFQLVMYQASGHVEFRYRDVDFADTDYDGGASATVGLVGSSAGPSLEHSCDSAALTDGTSIAFYRHR